MTPPKRPGFGSELIEQQLRQDLDGALKTDFNEAGLRSRIDLPLKVLAGRGKGLEMRG